MNSNAEHPMPRGTEAGVTLVELMVSAVLTFVLAGLGYGAVVFLHSATAVNSAKLQQEATSRDGVHWIREELRMASLDPDPATGLLRYRIESVPGCGKALVYRRIEGVRMVGSDMQTIWSPECRLATDAKGVLRRTCGGESTVVANGVRELDVRVESGAFMVALTITARDPRDGRATEAVETVRIRPAN